MTFSGDPVGAGYVSSLARPGGNITGLSNVSPDLAGKRLELLRDVISKLSRVAVLVDPISKAGKRLQAQPQRWESNFKD